MQVIALIPNPPLFFCFFAACRRGRGKPSCTRAAQGMLHFSAMCILWYTKTVQREDGEAFPKKKSGPPLFYM